MAGVIGLMMACLVSKMGNPVIFEALATPPADIYEFLLAVWPTRWAYWLLIPTLLICFPFAKFNIRVPNWLFGLLIGWLVWCWFSTARSVLPQLSQLTIWHFTATAAVFFLGLFALGKNDDTWFWRLMVVAFLYVMWVGFDQQYGGLEAMRKMFMEQPNWEQAPPEMKLKMMTNRIFGPFIYPNTFAGALLLWIPALTIAFWNWTARLPSVVQKVCVGLFVYAAAACLFWTGSKAGWLIAIVVAAIGLLHLRVKTTIKVGFVTAVLVVGLAGFLVKYRAYFEKGATSASARLIYWQAALKIANSRPMLGSGPGTFGKMYAPIKPEGAEMAKLAHNDYLEQASDSGWLAALLFSGFIGGGLVLAHRRVGRSPLHFAVWLGLVAWALQGFVEFGLYIPAMSWSAFLLLGWLLASEPIDSPK